MRVMTKQTFTIDINGDNTPEFPETFTVTLSNAGAGAQLADDPTAQGTINNDDGHGIRILAAECSRRC